MIPCSRTTKERFPNVVPSSKEFGLSTNWSTCLFEYVQNQALRTPHYSLAKTGITLEASFLIPTFNYQMLGIITAHLHTHLYHSVDNCTGLCSGPCVGSWPSRLLPTQRPSLWHTGGQLWRPSNFLHSFLCTCYNTPHPLHQNPGSPQPRSIWQLNSNKAEALSLSLTDAKPITLSQSLFAPSTLNLLHLKLPSMYFLKTCSCPLTRI